ncbi:MAG: penicillin-binding protein 2 [Opitutaceae bacterium]|nr:penicillin-binding protein 2 [Opitutaceae bacterium]
MGSHPQSTEHTTSGLEAHKGYDTRILFFYPVVALLILVLGGGLAYQQLIKSDVYHERERQQNQRRILMPGPRGNIYDREGRLLVGNRARFSVTLNLDELRKEFRREEILIRKNYRELGDKDLPNAGQIRQIARYTVVQRYLDQINATLGRTDKVEAGDLNRHFNQQLLLPFILIDDLKPEEYAKLVEQLPVRSPLQVYAASTRYYPYKSAAAHTLGYVLADDEVSISDFPGEELTTFKMRGTVGKDGLERRYNDTLKGQAGGTIYRVDPAGYRVEPPLHRRVPVQGDNITTSLDIDLQQAAEEAMGDEDSEGNAGAAVAIDVNTGEVLVLASSPNYDLNDFTPRLSNEKAKVIHESGAWSNRALQGLYPPGSSFKILTAIAGLHAGTTRVDSEVHCLGQLQVGNRMFPCHDRHAHGQIGLPQSISLSCNVFFYSQGLAMGADALANEAKRFQLDKPTGIELPFETRRMLVPSTEWKQKHFSQRWFPGDTANFSIGQGFLVVTPLQMATFIASVARNEIHTPPTLIHDPNRPKLKTESIGLTPQQRAALVDGMRQCTLTGTAKILSRVYKLDDLKIAGKTGTAQKAVYEDGKQKGIINFAWFICFAPYDNPKIAIAVVMEGDTLGEEYGGGLKAAPIAGSILQKYFEKEALRLRR